MTQRKVLVIVPYPDDETFGSGGTLLQFLARDEPCGLVTLTLGDAGKPLGLYESRAELAELRRHELQTCLTTLGLHSFESNHSPYRTPCISSVLVLSKSVPASLKEKENARFWGAWRTRTAELT